MKKLILSLLALAVGSMAWAQNNGLNSIWEIQVEDLENHITSKKVEASDVVDAITSLAVKGTASTTSRHHEDKIPSINAHVRSAFGYVRRFVPVTTLSEEGNRLVLTGSINQITTKSEHKVYETKDSKGKIVKNYELIYKGTVSVTLTLKNLTNGASNSYTFEEERKSSGEKASSESALAATIADLEYDIANYYNAMYPIRANMIEHGAEKKDKAKEIYLDVGQNARVSVGMHFNVFVTNQIAGREIKKPIGRIKVLEVLGEDISLCKVQKGGKEIHAAFAGGQKITVQSGN